MFNLTVAGNTTADATKQEVQTQSGLYYAIRFTLAVNQRFKDTQQTTYLNCTYWSKSDKIVQHLKKGTALIVQANWYTNEKGTQGDRYFQEFRVTNVEFQQGKPKDQPTTNVPADIAAKPEEKNPNWGYNPNQTANTNNAAGEDEDDGLPF